MSKYSNWLIWTKSAYQCYKRGCICGEDCDNYKYCKDIICDIKPMKKTVIGLINRYGVKGIEDYEKRRKSWVEENYGSDL